MITFGFKNKVSGWLRALIAIVIGFLILFCTNRDTDILTIIVKVFAAFLLVAGVISFIYGYVNRKRGVLGILAANAIIDVVVGIVLFCFAKPVTAFLVIVIGIVILVCSIWEIIVLCSIVKTSKISFGAFILPIICALAGIYIIIYWKKIPQAINIVAGIALLVYGVSEFIATWRMNKAMKARNAADAAEADAKASAQADMADAKETDYEKVDEE
ncbi:MAG: DUF308 domain-containing protein [Bacteroidales bacterium]|nr:DUF308 domain-containing protein [Bacteroidales bacterium]